MIRGLIFSALVLMGGTAASQTPPPEKIVAGLSQNRVSITANFDGSSFIGYWLFWL